MRRYTRSKLFVAVAAVLLVFTTAGLPARSRDQNDASTPAVAQGLDHVPIAVRDLGEAARAFQALGFVLKPGTQHANGIRNQHIKFSDGTELELITVEGARDALTAEYQQFLASGDGPALLGLYAPDNTALTERLQAVKQGYQRDSGMVRFPTASPLRYIFFWRRNASPTDLPAHFAHANSATSLMGVWLAADDFTAETALLSQLGAAGSVGTACTPTCADRQRCRVRDAEITLLPASRQVVPGRRIVVAVIQVRSVQSAIASLSPAQQTTLQRVTAGGRDSVFVPPDAAHGLWLEFREMR